MNTKFDDIRPYDESEIPAAMARIADSEYLSMMSEFIFPQEKVEDVRQMIRQIWSTSEFQRKTMYPFNQKVLAESANELTYDGMDFLDPNKNYLFVSNHRDIVMDSCTLQYILHVNGFQTTEITFGSNLMSSQLIVDIGKSNKMFKVQRSGKISDFYKNSLHLSEYLRYTIKEKKESIWIAQRNGRTKDGNDITDQGIIKMFCMSNTNNLPYSLDELHIVPVAISYQFESCDFLKTRELYLSRNGNKYIKQEGEDLNSILTGFKQYKGNIHLSICEPIQKEELTAINYHRPNEFYKLVASLIDKRIHLRYRLFNNNYIAYDLLSNKKTFAEQYSEGDEKAFHSRMEQMLKQIEGDPNELKMIFLGIYANPVYNYLSLKP